MHKQFAKNPQWLAVLSVAATLKVKGFSSFVVGGCVRDFLLKREPKDFDMVTDAKIEKLLQIFPQALTVGVEFGVLVLGYKDFQIELSSFRKDGEYKDGRRPSEVKTGNIKEDAARRDFSFNALFYNLEKKELLDFHNGVVDLKQGVIKTVGKPSKRFKEDHLRMLRAIRFAVELKFSIEEETHQAILTQGQLLKKISKERLGGEFKKILSANFIKGIVLLEQTHLLKHLSVELSNHLWEKTLVKIKPSKLLLKQTSANCLRSCFVLISLILIKREKLDPFKKALLFIEDLKEIKFTKKEVQSLKEVTRLLNLLFTFSLKDFLDEGHKEEEVLVLAQKVLSADKVSKVSEKKLASHYHFADLVRVSQWSTEVEILAECILLNPNLYPSFFINNLNLYIQVLELIKRKPVSFPKWQEDYKCIAARNRSKFLKVVYSTKALCLVAKP